jgi:DNA-binding NtrC family response regulator
MGKRVLLLEDERKTAELIVMASNDLKLGIDWTHCLTNDEALAVKEEPDAMLIDLILKNSECGLDFLRTVRVTRGWQCPARVFTGHHDDFDLVANADRLDARVLPKPPSSDELFAWLMDGPKHHQRALQLVQPLLASEPPPSERFIRMLGAKPLAKGEFREHLNAYEREIIDETRRIAGGSKRATADRLGVDRSYVQKKLR